MMRHIVQITVLTGILVAGMVSVTLARDDRIPVSTGVVATIIGIDAHHGMATLQTEAGEVFQLRQEWSWKVGDKVECDRIDDAARPWLQNCRPWQ